MRLMLDTNLWSYIADQGLDVELEARTSQTGCLVPEGTLANLVCGLDPMGVRHRPNIGSTASSRKGCCQNVRCDQQPQVSGPPITIEKTLSTRLQPGESPDAFARRCSEIAALGIEHIVVIVAGPWTDEAVATVAAAARRC